MAALAVGQRVAFKDDARKGTVISSLPDGRVFVRCDDGMDFPARPSELVALGKKPGMASDAPRPVDPPRPIQTVPSKPSIAPTGTKLTKPCLVFLADDAEMPENSDLAVLAVNPTNWFIKLHFLVDDDDNGLMQLQASIDLKPNSSETLLKLRRSQMGSVGNMRAEALFYADFGFKPQAPVAIEIKANPKRFLKPGSFTPLQGYGMGIVHLLENPIPQATPHVSVSPDRPKTPKAKVRLIEEEIDLHIEKFDPSARHLSDHLILLRQLAHCQKHLNRALAEGHLSMVFIHGIGSGRLKAEVLNLIREHQLTAHPIPHNPGAVRVILKWGLD